MPANEFVAAAQAIGLDVFTRTVGEIVKTKRLRSESYLGTDKDWNDISRRSPFAGVARAVSEAEEYAQWGPFADVSQVEAWQRASGGKVQHFKNLFDQMWWSKNDPSALLRSLRSVEFDAEFFDTRNTGCNDFLERLTENYDLTEGALLPNRHHGITSMVAYEGLLESGEAFAITCSLDAKFMTLRVFGADDEFKKRFEKSDPVFQ